MMDVIRDAGVRLCAELGAVLCVPCSCAVELPSVAEHLRKTHKVSRSTAKEVSDACCSELAKIPSPSMRSLYLDPSRIVEPLPALPILPVKMGIACGECKLWCLTEEAVYRHYSVAHRGKLGSRKDVGTLKRIAVQCPFARKNKRIVFPVIDGTHIEEGERSNPSSTIYDIVGQGGDGTIPSDVRELSTFIATTRLDKDLKELGVSMSTAFDLACHARPSERHIVSALERYLMESKSVHGSEWSLPESMMRSVAPPGVSSFTVAVSDATISRYAREFARPLLFVFRVAQASGCAVELSQDVVSMAGGVLSSTEYSEQNLNSTILHPVLRSIFLEIAGETRSGTMTMEKFLPCAAVRKAVEGSSNDFWLTDGKSFSPLLAALIFGTSCVALHEVYAPSSSACSTSDRVQFVKKVMREDVNSQVTVLQRMMKIAARLRSSEMPKVRFLKCYVHPNCAYLDGIELGAETVGDAVKKVHEELSETFKKLNFGKLMPESLLQGLKDCSDNIANCSPGFCFAVHPQNNTRVQAVWNWMQSNVIEGNLVNSDGCVLDAAYANWIKYAVRALKDIAVMVHLSGGSPSRGSELSILRVRNTSADVRNIFLVNGEVTIIPGYTKTRHVKQGRVKMLARFPDATSSRLLIQYILCVHYTWLALEMMSKPNDANVKYEFSFIFNRLRSGVGEKAAKRWREYGIQLSISQYRQWHSGILKHCVGGAKTSADEDEESDDDVLRTMHEQAGHSRSTANTFYGVSQQDPSGFYLLDEYRVASRTWHAITGLALEHTGAHSQPAPNALPPVARIFEKSGKISAIQALKALFGHGAHFKSQAQERSIAAALERKQDILVVLPTGGGKSSVFMAPCSVEKGKVTVVVVPLRALLEDLLVRCNKAGICAVTLQSCETPDARLVVASFEQVMQNSYKDFVCRTAADGRLSRIVIDEAHLVDSWSSFRNSLLQARECVRPIGVKVPLVLMSATVPPPLVAETFEACGSSLSHSQVVRMETCRSNIRYSVTISSNKGYGIGSILGDSMECFFSSLFSKEGVLHGRAIIYCMTQRHAEVTKSVVEQEFRKRYIVGHAYLYHAGLPQEARTDAARSWSRTPTAGSTHVMVASVAFGTGIDVPDVRVVMHVGGSRSVMEFAQESGRGGRDGKIAESVVMYSKAYVENICGATNEKYGSFSRWAEDVSTCYRARLESFLDGVPAETCVEREVEKCSACPESATTRPRKLPRREIYDNIGAAGSGTSSYGGNLCSSGRRAETPAEEEMESITVAVQENMERIATDREDAARFRRICLELNRFCVVCIEEKTSNSHLFCEGTFRVCFRCMQPNPLHNSKNCRSPIWPSSSSARPVCAVCCMATYKGKLLHVTGEYGKRGKCPFENALKIAMSMRWKAEMSNRLKKKFPQIAEMDIRDYHRWLVQDSASQGPNLYSVARFMVENQPWKY